MAASLLGLSDDYAEVMLPGGPLQIAWPDQSGSVWMTGPAEAVFDGVLTLSWCRLQRTQPTLQRFLHQKLRRLSSLPVMPSTVPAIASKVVSDPITVSAMKPRAKSRTSSTAHRSMRC